MYTAEWKKNSSELYLETTVTALNYGIICNLKQFSNSLYLHFNGRLTYKMAPKFYLFWLKLHNSQG